MNVFDIKNKSQKLCMKNNRNRGNPEYRELFTVNVSSSVTASTLLTKLRTLAPDFNFS